MTKGHKPSAASKNWGSGHYRSDSESLQDCRDKLMKDKGFNGKNLLLIGSDFVSGPKKMRKYTPVGRKSDGGE